ncbi:MAG: ThiF family adenylyltransferase [Promethearchaeota archaeon]
MAEDIENLEYELYERQRRISIFDQNTIRNSSVLIVGVGGLGCEIVKNLALIGLGKLIIVDMDRVEISNLSHQLLYSFSDIHKPKVKVIEEKIKNLNPLIEIETYYCKIEEAPMNLFNKADLILGCLDNWGARQYINQKCIQFKTILIDGAIEGFNGTIQIVFPRKTGCLACGNLPPPKDRGFIEHCGGPPSEPRTRMDCIQLGLSQFENKFNKYFDENKKNEIEDLLKIINSITNKFNYSDFTEFEIKNYFFRRIPNILTTNAIIAGIQSQEGIKILMLNNMDMLEDVKKKNLKKLIKNKSFQIPNFILYSGLTGTFTTWNLEKDPDCNVCGPEEEIISISIKKEAVVRDIFIELEKLRNLENGIENYLIFRENKLILPEDKLKNVIFNKDYIVMSSLTDEEEYKIQITLLND